MAETFNVIRAVSALQDGTGVSASEARACTLEEMLLALEKVWGGWLGEGGTRGGTLGASLGTGGGVAGTWHLLRGARGTRDLEG